MPNLMCGQSSGLCHEAAVYALCRPQDARIVSACCDSPLHVADMLKDHLGPGQQTGLFVVRCDAGSFASRGAVEPLSLFQSYLRYVMTTGRV